MTRPFPTGAITTVSGSAVVVRGDDIDTDPVSYTHLTLPTKA